jgi:LPXTG-motif cell wall-anchored protein
MDLDGHRDRGIPGPDDAIDATIEQLTPVGWRPLATEDAGFAATFLAVVTSFGDYALVAPGPGPSYPTTASSAAPGRSAGSPAASGARNTSSPGTSTAVGAPASTSPSPPADGSTGGGSPPWFAFAGVALAAGVGLVVWTLRKRPPLRRRQATRVKRRP